jgi:aspartate racemase
MLMKTIGLIGGTSWVSTVEYYTLINRLTHEKLGASNAARIILYSINFQDFKDLLDADDWDRIAVLFTDVAAKLKTAGADCILIGANNPHQFHYHLYILQKQLQRKL